jgi:hypothetical protein
MKKSRQLSFLPDPPKTRRAAPLARLQGIVIDPDEIVTTLDQAIEKLGREIGRIGTVLNQIGDYELVGSFSHLYGNHIMRYADVLLKQRILQDPSSDTLLQLLNPALDRLNEETELEL